MRFSLGIDDFKTLRTEKDSKEQLCFYCDKSLFIEDIINDGANVLVFPRPRRFGKTLNMSMLKYFFDINHPENGTLFENLKITKNKNIMGDWQGKYPVVFIGFKAIKCDSFDTFIIAFKHCIFNCYKEFEYLRTSSKLTDIDKIQIEPYFSPNFETTLFENSLKYLTEMLAKHHSQKVILLIDEYDTPLQTAYLKGFYKEALTPFKTMLGEVLKSNVHLYKGIVTGITRIAKESLFSDVNNIKVCDITKQQYAQYFGFTEEEIVTICNPEHLDHLRMWYNGYRFGNNITVYNPWSVLSFLDNQHQLEPYWINTSSNDLIRQSLTADKLADVRILIEGGSLPVEIEPFTVLDNLKENRTSFWNLLFMSGYLTLDADKKMRIPNQEIRYFFEKVVVAWFGHGRGPNFLDDFLAALLDGDFQGAQALLSRIALESFSFKDVTRKNQESFYHGVFLGITLGLKDRYVVKSNRESGLGVYDIALYPNNPQKDPGVVIELKTQGTAEQALLQIQDKAYTTDLHQHGCKTIHSYGIHFDGKQVAVKLVTENRGGALEQLL